MLVYYILIYFIIVVLFPRYCGVCGVSLKRSSKFCWKCNADQTKIRPGINVSDFTSSNASKPSENFKKAMGFEEYRKSKRAQQQHGCNFRTKKIKTNETVTINLGIKRLENFDLKTIRGKRLPIMVPRNATYKTILEKGIEKWTAYDRNFNALKDYVVLYDDGTLAQFMPGERLTIYYILHYTKMSLIFFYSFLVLS